MKEIQKSTLDKLNECYSVGTIFSSPRNPHEVLGFGKWEKWGNPSQEVKFAEGYEDMASKTVVSQSIYWVRVE